LLSQLLTELEGVGKGEGARVVVIGATNRPDLLDEALVRPGRLDSFIYVGPPDEASRKKILELNLRGVAGGEKLDLDEVAREGVTGGLSGAEVVGAVREACLLTIEEFEEKGDKDKGKDKGLEKNNDGAVEVTMEHLLKACRSTKKQITPEMLQFYARFKRK